MDNHFQPLLTSLKLEFRNPMLLVTAFTHRSYLNEAGKNLSSNERLEFLGDAVLSFLVSEYLYNQYPEHPEGILTNLRSTVVKTETLSDISRELKFGEYLLLSHGEEKGGGRTNPSLLADTFEAVLGAVFLDQGIDKTRDYLSNVLFMKMTSILEAKLHTDFKSRLQEIVQVNSDLPPTYHVAKTEGPDHAKQFWVTVLVDGAKKETGVGHSKQEAEQDAARLTLEKMGKT
ncbi:MAG: ribonuclease III [Patescibacteria group bacterium]